MEGLFKTEQFLLLVFTFSAQFGKGRKSYALPILGFTTTDERTGGE